MRKSCSLLAVLALPPTAGLAHAHSAQEDAGWKFRITPYLWAPSIEGTVSVDGIGGDAVDDGGSALDNLSGVAMLTFEANRGDWGLIADFFWAEFSLEGTLDNAFATPFEAENNELLIGLGATRTLSRGETAQLDGVLGLRYLHVDLSVDTLGASGFSVSEDADLLDPFIGLRGRVGEETGLFGLAYGDIGGFGVSADLTWQILLGGGWAWSWGDVRIGWRELAYDFESGGLLYDLQAGGPFLGLSFVF
jgi:hypothetical protein